MTHDVVDVTELTLREWPLPGAGSDKNARGAVLVVGGGRETPGAVLLAGEAALRAGAGKLQLATAASAGAALGVAVPEARVIPLPETDDGVPSASGADRVVGPAGSAAAVLLGPGLADPAGAVALLEAIVPRLEVPVVVDALGTAFVTEHPDGLRHLPGAVLNVNPTELSRVLDRDEVEVGADPVRHAADAAERTGAVVLCGGTEKVVAAPDGRRWVVRTGNPGLGVSGSGDVQAGLLAGLVARGVEAPQAAVWGAYLHGTAGDRVASSAGPLGYLARELLPVLPRVLADLA